MIKTGIKGLIIKGKYSPVGKVQVEDDRDNTGGYYIYEWPNTGETFPNSDIELVYDTWYDGFKNVENHFRRNKWKIQWDES